MRVHARVHGAGMRTAWCGRHASMSTACCVRNCAHSMLCPHTKLYGHNMLLRVPISGRSFLVFNRIPLQSLWHQLLLRQSDPRTSRSDKRLFHHGDDYPPSTPLVVVATGLNHLLSRSRIACGNTFATRYSRKAPRLPKSSIT